MSHARTRLPYISPHVLDRFIERFPSDAATSLTPHEIRQTILRAWDSGAPWGVTAGDGETRLGTLPSGAQIVMPTKLNVHHGSLEMRTVLTYEQALANQQVAFAGRWSHDRVAKYGAPGGRRSRRRR